MTNTTRRELIKGAVAASVAAPMAALPALAQEGTDPLIALWDKRGSIATQVAAARSRCDEKECEYEAATASLFIVPADHPGFSGTGLVGKKFRSRYELERYGLGEAAVLNMLRGEPTASLPSELERHHKARLAWWDEQKCEADRLSESTGYNAADEEVDRLYDALWHVDAEIARTPATSTAGLLIKLRCAVANLRENGPIDGPPDDSAETGYAIRLLTAVAHDAERLLT